MIEFNVAPALWLVGFQMGLYALAWVLCATLLGKDRAAVVHWGIFLLLAGVVMLLAGARGEPRQWLYYNGANVLSLIAFAMMRRGIELFMRLRPSDREMVVVLLVVAGSIAALGPHEEHASWRIVLSYGGQGYLLLRTMWRVGRPLRAEFGRGSLFAIVGPGVLIGLMLASLSLRQVLDMGRPMEMHHDTGTSYGLMYYYLGGVALFNFGFMVMLTQRLVVSLRHVSKHDELTGLFNRRAMNEELDRQWQRHLRGRRPFAVLLIDIDHFKRINDNYGHAVGDEVLAQVARLLQSHARRTDSVARMGGEEFLILLPDMDAAAALNLAQRLRETIESEPVLTADAALYTTVSVGVAVVRSDDGGAQPLVRRADDALYRAKAAGRNRCELAVAKPAAARSRNVAQVEVC
jgi:diguanylate cyclase (GGDEF)-like protein